MTLLMLAAAFLAGVAIGEQVGPPASALWLVALACALLWVLLVSVRRSPFPAVLVVCLLLGAIRLAVAGGGVESSLAEYHSQGRLALQGVVVGDVERAGQAVRFRLAADRVRTESRWTQAAGDVRVTVVVPPEIARDRTSPYLLHGDRLMLEGVLLPPPELDGFDYPAYLARQGIGSVMSFPSAALLEDTGGLDLRRWLQGARRSIADSLARVVPEPQAALGQALLVGVREDLPPDLVEEFRETGTSHLLAISGLHIGILLGFTLAAGRGVMGRRGQRYLLVPLVLIWAYALLAGMSPSVTRAAIMGSVFLAAHAVGRPSSVLPALGLAAAIMVALDPSALWRVSFQLSFAAMSGIAVVAMPVARWLKTRAGLEAEGGVDRSSLLSHAVDVVAMGVGATIATLPLVAFYFERFSLVGRPATLLSIPALPVVLATHALAGGVGLLATSVAAPFGWVAWLATSYLMGVVGLFARLPGASFDTGPIAPWLVWGYYAALVLWLGRKRLRSSSARLMGRLRPLPPLREVKVPTWLASVALLGAGLVWAAALSLPDGKLHVTFADVGQGDAAYITTPGGRHILVDGGTDPDAAVKLLGERLPFWDRTIDLVVLTHPHGDHAGGLAEALGRYDVRAIIEREVPYDSVAYQEWRRAVEAEGASVTQAQAGQVIVFDDGVYLQVLGPPATLLQGTASDIDNASVLLRLVYGEVSFLLTGDIFSQGEAALVGRGAPIDSDVLKVAHHGSRSSSSAGFLSRVTPVAAVISAGGGNSYGHPHVETLGALRSAVDDDLFFVTMDTGAVEFITDGRRLEVRTER